jgi:hypothetical protein
VFSKATELRETSPFVCLLEEADVLNHIPVVDKVGRLIRRQLPASIFKDYFL